MSFFEMVQCNKNGSDLLIYTFMTSYISTKWVARLCECRLMQTKAYLNLSLSVWLVAHFSALILPVKHPGLCCSRHDRWDARPAPAITKIATDVHPILVKFVALEQKQWMLKLNHSSIDTFSRFCFYLLVFVYSCFSNKWDLHPDCIGQHIFSDGFQQSLSHRPLPSFQEQIINSASSRFLSTGE